MPSAEIRRLQGKWALGNGWPKRLDWVEIEGIRGWAGQRFELRFPIMAIVGENGAGKSTVLQAAASVYAADGEGRKDRFASDFFPDTTWDQVRNATIRYAVREGGTPHSSSVRKPTDRWRGNPDRRRRHVEYIDLSRVQPVPGRVGYMKLANASYKEVAAKAFSPERLGRLSSILGRRYDLAKMSVTNADQNRSVPVISHGDRMYSGFHQGAGETTIAELLQADIPRYSLVLIDEIESSLHPRAQRRLMRDLATLCRVNELQIILTTHSPYILEELPLDGRAYILQPAGGARELVYGVSPEFAMTKMDDVAHYECDLYVEDARAATMLVELLTAHAPDLVQRCQVIPSGAASVGQALGQMVAGDRFPQPSCVFLDGDKGPAPGCAVLPGEDAPERVVFDALAARHWVGLETRIGRTYGQVVDACTRAHATQSHHEWVAMAARDLVIGAEILWQAMCAEWATNSLAELEALPLTEYIEDRLAGLKEADRPAPLPVTPPPAATPKPPPATPKPPPAPRLL